MKPSEIIGMASGMAITATAVMAVIAFLYDIKTDVAVLKHDVAYIKALIAPTHDAAHYSE